MPIIVSQLHMKIFAVYGNFDEYGRHLWSKLRTTRKDTRKKVDSVVSVYSQTNHILRFYGFLIQCHNVCSVYSLLYRKFCEWIWLLWFICALYSFSLSRLFLFPFTCNKRSQYIHIYAGCTLHSAHFCAHSKRNTHNTQLLTTFV